MNEWMKKYKKLWLKSTYVYIKYSYRFNNNDTRNNKNIVSYHGYYYSIIIIIIELD